MKPAKDRQKTKVQGEGDYAAARRYRKDAEQFVRSNDTEELARKAKPESPEEADELERAEDLGRSRSRGEPESSASHEPARETVAKRSPDKK